MAADPFKFDGHLNQSKLDLILPYCEKKILDVGCNTGALVSYLNSNGFYAEGIDADEQCIKKAREQSKDLRFHHGSSLSDFSNDQFETVVAWNVLEHIQEDDFALGEMLRIASKRVVLCVPREDQISLPYSGVTYRQYVDPTHVHYYTRELLTSMIAKHGSYRITFQNPSRVRPLLAYEKIGVPRIICAVLDRILWKISSKKDLFYSDIMVVIHKGAAD
ncbi:MAG: class I SAM-dependent methyltransferase [Oligoflexales bacterium]|nr:class I SAM-dependent methyltransferase [Oligoflexales bacterium]